MFSILWVDFDKCSNVATVSRHIGLLLQRRNKFKRICANQHKRIQFSLQLVWHYTCTYRISSLGSPEIPEGVSPWALLRLAGGGNVSNFEKLTFLFFSDSDSFGSKKNRAKKIFSKFENFSVSVFHCFSQFLLFDYLRNYHVFRHKTGERKVLLGLGVVPPT